MRSILRSCLVMACVALALPVHAEPLLDRVKRDELLLVPNKDPHMAAAIRKARAGLKDFLALAGKPRAQTTGFAVKVAVRDEKETEYFWITPFEAKNGKFTGAIDNDPGLVRNVRLGQTIEFGEDEIVDWLYLDGRKMMGNHTACVLIRHEPKEEQDAFKKEFGLDCDG